MDQYRELNKQMVREVQTMRTNLRLYSDEIVNLKAELMQKHEVEINLRKILYKIIVQNCLQLTEIVNPDAEVIPLLKESLADLNISKVQRDSNKRQTNTRRSNQLSAELRRSFSVINIASPMHSISPIRRRLSGLNGENVQTEQNAESEQPVENERQGQSGPEGNEPLRYGSSEENENENRITNTCVLYEESEEDRTNNETADEESSQDVVSVDTDEDDSDAEVSDNIMSCAHGTLRDVTNILTQTMELTCNTTKQKSESNSKKCKKQNVQNLSKTADTSANATTHIEKQVRISRKKLSKINVKFSDCSASEIDEGTLQEPRRSSCARELGTINRSIPITEQNSNTSGEEATIVSLNFCEAASSTPNSRRISSPNSTRVEDSLTTSISTRPVRQCRPKLLIEPKLNSKLRNESSESLNKRSKKIKK